MTADDGPPLSLRPFPVANQKPKTLAEFIARVNAQPGGFRATTKEKLEEEICANQSKDGADDVEDMQMSDGEGDDSASNEGEPESSIKDPNQARMEVLRDMEYGSHHGQIIRVKTDKPFATASWETLPCLH